MIFSTPPVSEFNTLTRQLTGMTVSLPWKGMGSTIFLELGQLSLPKERRVHEKGEACITLEWEWRVEEGVRILYGSSNSSPEIDRVIHELQGTSIDALSVVGQVPELLIHFSNGQRLHSMSMQTGEPRWCIRLPDRTWLTARKGALEISDGSRDTSAGMSDREAEAFDTAEACFLRWGTPVSKPKEGNCSDCKHYIRLDGDGHLLDYGVCTEAHSPLDGRVVNCESGCPMFTQ